MTVETRYMRYDNHTVNGLNGGVLGTSQTDTQDYAIVMGEYGEGAYWAWDILKRSSAGDETLIGDKVAQVFRAETGWGLQDNTWDCPETHLFATDALVARPFISPDADDWTATGYGDGNGHITEQMGSPPVKLENAEWTIYTFTFLYGIDTAEILWGNLDYNTHIENFTYSTGTEHEQGFIEYLGFTDSFSLQHGIGHPVTMTEYLGFSDSFSSVMGLARFQSFIEYLGLSDKLTPLWAEIFVDYSDQWRDLKRLVENVKGVGSDGLKVTYYRLTLGSRDSQTGHRQVNYGEKQIDMIVWNKGAFREAAQAGFLVRLDAVGVTGFPVLLGGKIKTQGGTVYRIMSIIPHLIAKLLVYYECDLQELPFEEAE